MNCVRGSEEGIQAHQRRELAAGRGEKWTVGIVPEAQGADARRIVKRKRVINVAIRLLGQHLLANGPLDQHAAPAVRPAVLNGSEERSAMMRSALQWKRGGVDGERVRSLEPFERILKRDGRSLFSRMEPPHEMGLLPPINMNFKAHERGRRMRCGRRRSSRLRASSSLAGAARFARRSCNPRTKVAVTKVPSATVGSPRSNRQSVSRLTKRRAAMSLVEMPRLRRASARSRPNLRSAWAAGNGIEFAFDMEVVSYMAEIKSNKAFFV